MAIKYFWIYIGTFFAGAFILFASVKRFAKAFAGKGLKPVLYGIAAALVFGGLSFLSTLAPFNEYVIFWLAALVFLGFGIFHMLVFHKKYFYPEPHTKGGVVIGELLFSFALLFFCVVVFSALVYFVLENKNYPFYPMLTCMLAFFVPVSLYYTFQAAYSIPDPVFASWIYPLHEQIDLPDEKPNEKLVVIAFEIAKKETSEHKTNFRAKGPETMKLGDLYYHFINDYNELHSETMIDFADEHHESYEWWFRLKPKWYQSNKILDPELTVRENKIKENSIIICERFEMIQL
jgi:Type VI secretion system, TssN